MKPTRCPKCGGKMFAGYPLDCGKNGCRVAQWVEGEPARGWFGLLKLRGRRRLEVTTWRCGSCGYLESWAG